MENLTGINTYIRIFLSYQKATIRKCKNTVGSNLPRLAGLSVFPGAAADKANLFREASTGGI